MDINFKGIKLNHDQLLDIRDDLCKKILDGLKTHGQEIKALPSYLRRPLKNLSGEAVVLDTGGTNIRAAKIQLQGGKSKLLAGPYWDSEVMKLARNSGQVNSNQFFERQADLIVKAISKDNTRLGYCFSYPAETKPDGDARLLRWTKGIDIPNVTGSPVGSQLLAVLYGKGTFIKSISVLNDTVASLIAGAWIAPEYDNYIGLIVATGTNMAGFFPVGQINKLTPVERNGWLDDEEMAINLESGNFTPPHLTIFDDILDSAALDDFPGTQRFEKAVSGEYLPRLFGLLVGRKTCLEYGFDPEDPKTHPGHLAMLREDTGFVGEAAKAVLNRSADMIAAALAGLIKVYGAAQKSVAILAEGALFWNIPGYCERVEKTLATLVDGEISTKMLRYSGEVDINLLGAAIAALSIREDNR